MVILEDTILFITLLCEEPCKLNVNVAPVGDLYYNHLLILHC